MSPQFGPELFNGPERYEYLLSGKLVELGLEVNVLTTWTKHSFQTSAFSSAWPRDSDERSEIIDGMRVQRFPVSFWLSPRMGHTLSRSILKRWRREEQSVWLDAQGLAQPGTLLPSSRALAPALLRSSDGAWARALFDAPAAASSRQRAQL